MAIANTQECVPGSARSHQLSLSKPQAGNLQLQLSPIKLLVERHVVVSFTGRTNGPSRDHSPLHVAKSLVKLLCRFSAAGAERYQSSTVFPGRVMQRVHERFAHALSAERTGNE